MTTTTPEDLLRLANLGWCSRRDLDAAVVALGGEVRRTADHPEEMVVLARTEVHCAREDDVVREISWFFDESRVEAACAISCSSKDARAMEAIERISLAVKRRIGSSTANRWIGERRRRRRPW